MSDIVLQLKYVVLFITALPFAVLYKFKSKKTPKTFAVVQMAKLGDMVCTTPMFRAIKNKYPNSMVVAVGNAINKEVLNYNKDVDQYVVFDGIIRTIKKLKENKIDFACVTGPGLVELAVLFIAGVPHIAVPKIVNGVSPYENIWFKILRIFCDTHDHRMRHYAPREYLRLLESVGIYEKDTTKHIAYSNEAMDKVLGYFSEKKIKNNNILVCISPSAGNKIKKWPADRFAAVAEYVRDTYGALVFVIGSKRDESEVLEMFSYIKQTRDIFNVCNMLSLDELKAFISKMNLFISVDTGPIYIAEAFGVATVDIVGPVDETEQPPIAQKHLVVVPEQPRIPELFVMDAHSKNFAEIERQTKSITTLAVCRACDIILSYVIKK